MLIRFSIENFLSFNARTEFSMLPGKSRIHTNHLIKPKSRNDIGLLKAAIIYGANASGKSNIAKALDFARKFILRGTTSENKKIDFQSFRLDKEALKKPSRIEIEIKHKDKCYAYGFVFDSTTIYEEWLYEINKNSEKTIFERKEGKEQKPIVTFVGIKFENPTEKQFLAFTAAGTRKNQLFLTECRVRNVKANVKNIDDILSVIDWFQNSLKIIFPNSKFGGIEFELRENQDISIIFHEFLNYFNTGIRGIELVDVDFDKIKDFPEELKKDILSDLSESTKAFITSPDKNITYALSKTKSEELKVFKMMTSHDVKGSTKPEFFEMNDESDGSQRIIDFIPVMMDLMKSDNVFIIDEIDRSLHPNLTCDFVDLFLSKSENVNSQLIATTHESSLLNQKIIRKDEIWFVVKDKFGASSFYSLEEFKIRFDKEIRKDYLLGRYKAVPVFGSRNKLSVLKS
jgi:AAA15 family ATPase/GTPase